MWDNVPNMCIIINMIVINNVFCITVGTAMVGWRVLVLRPKCIIMGRSTYLSVKYNLRLLLARLVLTTICLVFVFHNQVQLQGMEQ